MGAIDGSTLDPVYLLYALGASWVLVEVDEGLFKALLEDVQWELAMKEWRGVTPGTVVEALRHIFVHMVNKWLIKESWSMTTFALSQ